MLSPEAIHWQQQSDEAGITQVTSLWSPAHSAQFRWHHTFQLTVAASNLEAKPDHWKDFFCHSHYYTCPSHNLTAERTHHLPPKRKVQFQQPISISWVIPSGFSFSTGPQSHSYKMQWFDSRLEHSIGYLKCGLNSQQVTMKTLSKSIDI